MNFPRRKQLRLSQYDYSQNGCYYITICSYQRECIFGEVINSKMVLNDLGKLIETYWRNLPKRFPNISVTPYIVMPNHLHGIIIIDQTAALGCGKPHPYAPESTPTMNQRASIGNDGLFGIIRTFKSSTTTAANRIYETPGRKLWQRNYYDRIVRNEQELSKLTVYIQENALKWNGTV